MTNAIERAHDHSEAKLAELRDRLKVIVPGQEVVLTCGSYARREASSESDIDFYIIVPDAAAQQDEQLEGSEVQLAERVKEAITSVVPVEPSEDGAFSKVESAEAMLRNIGGDGDSNQKITRRMLMLLEGEWLYNRNGLRAVRRRMLERYIAEDMGDHQLALFLLNDIIRYYRTVAVDYEFKTTESAKPKPWGIRNVKLVFARKLLYISGVFSVAVTADHTRNKKIAILENLLAMPVIERMIEICGRSKMEKVLTSYNYFLEKLEDGKVRDHLKRLKKNERGDALFRELKNEGHRFTRELLMLFEGTFDSTHPIRRAVVL